MLFFLRRPQVTHGDWARAPGLTGDTDVEPMTLSFTTVVSSLVNRKQTTSSEHGFSETNLLLGGDDRVNLRPFQKRPFRHLARVPPSPECQNQKTAINTRHGSSSKRSAHSCLCPPLPPVPEPQRRCCEALCLHRGLSCPSLAHSPAALPGQLDVTAQPSGTLSQGAHTCLGSGP